MVVTATPVAKGGARICRAGAWQAPVERPYMQAMDKPNEPARHPQALPTAALVVPSPAAPSPGAKPPAEIGGPSGPEPTRYGDWERNGRCSDF